MAEKQGVSSFVLGKHQELEIAMIQATVQLTERVTGKLAGDHRWTAKDIEKHYRQFYTMIVESC